MQDLQKFRVPSGFRGKPGWFVQLWWFVDAVFFSTSPQLFYGWRRFLLRLFGAKIGTKVLIRPTVKITYPWKVEIGDYSWVGDNVTLYSLGDIVIGANSVISQKSYLCTGSHDYKLEDFPIFARPIVIGNECWIATDVFVGPGVTIEDRAVVSARSSVFKNISGDKLYAGTPARAIKGREVSQIF